MGRKKRKRNTLGRMLGLLIAFSLIAASSGLAMKKVDISNRNFYTGTERLKKKLENQSVRVVSFGRGMGTCSGVVIGKVESNHMVLTAKHCISLAEEFYIEHNKVLYVVVSPTDDLALVIVDGIVEGKTITNLAKEAAKLEDILHLIGYPAGNQYMSSGKVTRVGEDWNFTDLKSVGGTSGAGIFNVKGELIGILWGGYAGSETPYASIYEPLEDIKAFLATVLA